MDNEKLNATKSALEKIKGGMDKTDDKEKTANDSPENVMELVNDAIGLLEEAETSIPADKPEVAPTPAIAEVEEKPKMEKKAEKEDDTEKKEMSARIASLEKEIDDTKKAKLAEEISDIYPEGKREAKYAELIASEEDSTALEAQLKIAKDVSDAVNPSTGYKPAVTQSGFLKQASVTSIVPAWRT